MPSNRTARHRPADNLTPGDHINHQLDQDYDPMVWLVAHVAPYTDADHTPRVAATLTAINGGEPVLVRWKASELVTIATEQDIANARTEGKRYELALGLRRLADLILDKRLPVDWYANFSMIPNSPDDVTAWATAGGTEVDDNGEHLGVDFKLDGLNVRVHARKPIAEPGSQPAEAGA
ncbi:hypothetical protein [Micromonospora tarensis]|uniref:Uncharacterized protein n=1 Tax=Micromonospora tarensis TaxID=2806100 RepID=A0ABS1Y9Q9_9ACTN|nr:hypothetical protein [Micromonospora tarensis]MBM0274105.1 hypothetical protein [Micromonospora tarensis]